MLTNVLLRLKEEVAMDGDEGTSIADAWAYVERFLVEEIRDSNHHSSPTMIMPVVDFHYKSYFWPHFRYLPELSFFTKDQPFATTEQQLEDDPASEDRDDIGLEYILEDITHLHYDQVESKYGSRLCIVANEELREAQLFTGVQIGQPWPANLRSYLSTILHAREAGITQAELSKVWNTDPRISGHFVKKLEEKGAIYRTMAVVNSTRTNLCIHIRFKNRHPIPNLSDDLKSGNTNMLGMVFTRILFRDRLTQLLINAKDNMMYADDILIALGFDLSSSKTRKWFTRTTDYFCQDGLIQKLKTRSKGATREQRCIQLANSNFEPKPQLAQEWDDETSYSIDKFGDLNQFIVKARNGNSYSSKLLDAASLEYQILRLIQAAGDQGITQKDIASVLRCDNQRIMTRTLDRLYEINGDENFSHKLERVLEFVGRRRRYRYYFHYTKHLKLQESKTAHIVPINEDQLDLEEIDYHTPNIESTNCNKNTKKKIQRSSTSADSRSINRSENMNSPAQQTATPPRSDNHSSMQSPMYTVPTISTSKNAKDNSRQQINKYMEKRSQVLMALLEDENIVERGIGLSKLFLAKQAQLFGDNGNSTSLIDGKTIWRSVMTLENEGKLNICERQLQLLNGKTTTQQFILKKGVDSNGPLMERYFESIKERKVLHLTINKKKTSGMTNIQVERLDNQLPRLQQFKDHALLSNNHAEARRIGAQIQMIMTNSAISGGTTDRLERKKTGPSLEVGLKFGFVPCCMTRIKLFHLYLLETLAVDTCTERRITTTVLIYNMTLGFFCKVFGVFYYTDQFKDYMQDKSNHAVSLADLPGTIRSCIFRYMGRFRTRLRVLFGYLIVLGLAEKDGEMDMDSTSDRSLPALASIYKMMTKAGIRNYRLPGHPIIQEHSLLDRSGALMYWNNLAYLCTKTNFESGESATPLTTELANDTKWIRSLYSPNNWKSSKTFSKEQKSILDEHVDCNNQSTPLNRTAWCHAIASDLKVPVKAVRGYYRKIEMTMRRNSAWTQLKTCPSFETSREIKAITSETALRFKDNQKLMKLQEDPTHSRRFRCSDHTSWYKYNTPPSQSAQLQPNQNTWTPADDDILKLCYVILNHRKECGIRFIWKPMDGILGKFSRRQGIRRLSTIREIPKHSEDLQNIRIRWHRYYYQGVTKGSLVSWEKTNGYDCDITPYITYYIDQYQLECLNAPLVSIYTRLPSNAQVLQQYYNLKYLNALNKHSCVFFEDNYHQRLSSTTIRQFMNSHPFTQRIHMNESYDHRSTQHLAGFKSDKRVIVLLQEFFKMILMTPDELYNPFYAHAILSNYPQTLLDMALEQSRKDGILVRTNAGHKTDRRIPKTSLIMSETFKRRINTQLPANIWSCALEYEKHLMSMTKTLLVARELDGGKMVCILDLLSQGKLSISIPDLNEIVDRFGSPRYTTRNIDETTLEYSLILEMTDHHYKHSSRKLNKQQEIQLLPGDLLESRLQKFCKNSWDKKISALVQQMVDYLHSQFSLGATLFELKQYILSEQGLDTLPDNLFLTGVDIITNQTKPPMATFVGHGDPRLVLTSELQPWTIAPQCKPDLYADTSNSKYTPPTHNSTIRPTPVSSGKHAKVYDPSRTTVPTKRTAISRQAKRRKLDYSVILTGEGKEITPQQQGKIIIPRLWNDIHGNRTDSIWINCMQLVVEAIMKRPGITFGHLRRIMKNTLSAVEIKELLNTLLDCGALRQLCVSVSISPSSLETNCRLFTSQTTPRTISPSSIDPSMQTSFWLQPGYYNHLPLE
ncbi:hypothetical protein BCR42DRAFT_403672 [Absidia repens]|uniref:Uncharacterized protein n=1 Tax=Absidia repens TaxID=90262 RepID=A0A1X2IV92_9FUNG|nr:hypothetical protein BCR42DRAFT_403672 [Absidia repens]